MQKCTCKKSIVTPEIIFHCYKCERVLCDKCVVYARGRDRLAGNEEWAHCKKCAGPATKKKTTVKKVPPTAKMTALFGG